MPLPSKPQARAGMPPRRARVMLGAAAKVGKTTLLGAWAPQTTLIIDTHNGTWLLEGEHYVQHVSSWIEFVQTVDAIVQGGHNFHTIGLDVVGDLWRFCDLHHGLRKDGLKVPASGMDDYGRSNVRARAAFNSQLGRLLAAPIGIWFLVHLREKTTKTGELNAYAPDLDKSIAGYVTGAVDFVWLAETLDNGRRVIHTKPTPHFEAGSRVDLPSPLDMNARSVALAMDRALNPHLYDEDGARIKVSEEAPEPVPEVAPEEAPPDDPTPMRDVERVEGPESDVTPDEPWWTMTIGPSLEAAKKLGMTSDMLREAVARAGGGVPERVSSWRRVICALTPGDQRLHFQQWLAAWRLEREDERDPTPIA